MYLHMRRGIGMWGVCEEIAYWSCTYPSAGQICPDQGLAATGTLQHAARSKDLHFIFLPEHKMNATRVYILCALPEINSPCTVILYRIAWKNEKKAYSYLPPRMSMTPPRNAKTSQRSNFERAKLLRMIQLFPTAIHACIRRY